MGISQLLKINYLKNESLALPKYANHQKKSNRYYTRGDHWAGDTSLVGAGVGSNPTRNQIFLITFDLVLDLDELDSSSIHSLKFYILIYKLESLS